MSAREFGLTVSKQTLARELRVLGSRELSDRLRRPALQPSGHRQRRWPFRSSSPALTSPPAPQIFHGLLRAWQLSLAWGWRMLTGLECQAESLATDQISRVRHLAAALHAWAEWSDGDKTEGGCCSRPLSGASHHAIQIHSHMVPSHPKAAV